MSFHGFPSGTVFKASARYNNKVMTEEEVDDFFARAALGSPPPQENGVQAPRRRQKSMDIKVHTLEDSPNDSPTDQLFHGVALLGEDQAESSRDNRTESSSGNLDASCSSGKGKTPVQQFVFGRNTTGQHKHSAFSFRSRNPGLMVENAFCKQCQTLIKKARAFKSKPNEGSRGGFSVYIEGENDGGDDRYGDVFSPGYGSYVTFVDLCKSAETGCHLCSLLAAPDPHANSNPPSECENGYMVGVYGEQSYDGPGRIEMQVMQYERKVINLSYDYPKAKLQGSLRYRRTDTGHVFALARDWLRQCRTGHDACQNRPEVDYTVPTRLLAVSAEPDGTLTSIRLRVTSTTPEDFSNVEYLAFSHCWGGVRTTCLETSTFASFQTSIPLASLPQNFLDAATITAKLGFKYLWIDSLCIIQDSPLDTAREIPTMGSVYGRAVLTIAALGAQNSHSGCFTTRNPLSLVPVLLRDGDSSTRDQVWAWNQRLQGPSAEGKLRPPLHQRGWVVQERALAPRTLSFGKDMVYWECLGGAASEASPEIREENESGLKIALAECSALDGEGWEDWETFWWEIVHEYTTAKLSYYSDRWNAISALAMRAEDYTGERLYNGLWECNLFEEVLWKCSQPGKRIDPADLDAPSWSWLSVDASVHNKQRFDYERTFKQVATVTKPLSVRYAADGLGRSKSLIIQGQLLKISWSTSRNQFGKTAYIFRFIDGPNLPRRSKCDWYPDVVPDEDWDLSVITMVLTKSGGCEAYGLVVKPNDVSGISWARVGVWQIFGYGDGGMDAIWGKKESITVV